MSVDTHVLVPREPTNEMYGAGGVEQFKADMACTPVREALRAVYQAMLAAAPPAPDAEGLVAELRAQKSRGISNSYEARDAMGRAADTITALTDRLAAAEAENAAIKTQQYVLGLVVEEAGEVLQLIGKSLRFGIDTPGRLNASGQVSGETPRTLLPAELGDLLAAISFMGLHGIVDPGDVGSAKARKLARLTDPAALDNLGRPLAPQPPSPKETGDGR